VFPVMIASDHHGFIGLRLESIRNIYQPSWAVRLCL
jgi:hypothetical protein